MANRRQTAVKVVDLAREGTLLPAPPGTCPECAVAHPPELPHDIQSLRYQYAHYGKTGTWPKLEDAMAHCSPEVREAWKAAMRAVVRGRKARGESVPRAFEELL